MSMQRCCPPATVAQADYSVAAELFKAMGDPHRLAILATLAKADGEVCVCDFTAGLPLNQPTVSHHLRILREGGLVACERRGTWVYYRLTERARAAVSDAIDAIFPVKVTK